MNNHFVFPYAGNKRQEVVKLHDYIVDKLDGIDTIIENFCGSSAMSYYISTKYPKRFKYILNDMNPRLIELYCLVKDKQKFDSFLIELNELVKLITSKEEYNKIVKPDTFIAWFISNLIHAIRPKLYVPNYKPKTYTFNDRGIIHFLQNEDVEIRSIDGCELLKQYENDSNVLLLVDPPYVLSDNSLYSHRTTDIYEYCGGNTLTTFKAFVIFVLEENWITRMLFKNNIKVSYPKKYESNGGVAGGIKKKTTHIIISNR